MHQGDCIFVRDKRPIIGTLSIIFEALVYKPHTGEIIAGCVVVENKPLNLVCRKDPIAIFISTEEDDGNRLSALRKGQIIPVVVTQSRLKLGKSTIAVKAKLYLPTLQPHIIRVLSESSAKNLVASASQIPGEYQQRLDTSGRVLRSADAFSGASHSLQLKRREYITDLFTEIRDAKIHIDAMKGTPPFAMAMSVLYPAIDAKTNTLPPNVEEIDIEDLTKGIPPAHPLVKNGGYLALFPSMHAPVFSRRVYLPASSDAIAATSVDMPAVDLESAIIAMANEYLSHVRLVLNFIETYGTKESIERHQSLWAIYRAAKTSSPKKN
ncbi:MAG: hypothetical protein M0R33_13920 [Methylomonas sp.]|nr:hypothetical protein [Methylomonas sp.]